MQRRRFISIALASIASSLALGKPAKLTKTTISNQPSPSDDGFVVVNNWYLKKDDLRNIKG